MATATRAVKFVCMSCAKKFTKKAATEYKFFPDTQLCYDCYVKGRETDSRKWCFGKRDVKKGETITSFGYDPERVECGDLCPHKKHCPLFIVKPYRVSGERVVTAKVDLLIQAGREQKVE